jgi:hypothetical protein
MPRKRVTLLEYLYRSVGYRKGTKAAAFIVAWGLYSDSLPDGSRPHMYGYSKFWKQSSASSYRELVVFHEVFPGDATPDRVWSVIGDVVESKKLADAMAQALRVEAVWSLG